MLATMLAADIFGRETAVIDLDLSGLTDDSSISTLLGSAPGLIGSDRPLPLHELRRTPWQVVIFRGIDVCAVSIRDTVAAALAAGSFTDAMGRRIPLGAAIALLTAPGVGASTDAPEAALLAARLGPALIAACDVITGRPRGPPPTPARPGSGTSSSLRSPLASSEPAIPRRSIRRSSAGWTRRLPADGSSPEGFLDQAVTTRIVAGLPASAGPLTIGLVDDQPAVPHR
jgi:hypothetical protein